MKRWIACLALVGCGEVKNESTPDAPIDAAPDSTPPVDGPRVCSPTAPFTSSTLIAEVSSTQRDERVTLSRDELEMYVTRLFPARIFRSTRSSAAASWSTPVLVDALNTRTDQGADMLSADGLTLYMTATDGSDQLMVATRSSPTATFGEASPLANVNSTDRELWGTATADDLVLHFHSDRDGTGRLYRATRTSTTAPFGAPVIAEAPADLFSPTIVEGGLGLYYTVLGTGVFYTSRSSLTEAFPDGTLLDNIPGGWVTWISPDHCHAYFNVELKNGVGDIDVYLATREPE